MLREATSTLETLSCAKEKAPCVCSGNVLCVLWVHASHFNFMLLVLHSSAFTGRNINEKTASQRAINLWFYLSLGAQPFFSYP